MDKINIGIENAKVSLLSDEAYYDALKLLISKAERRIYLSLFIVELFDPKSENPLVTSLLQDIKKSVNRGVHTRLIIGGSKENIEIQDITETSWKHCNKLGIPTELVALKKTKSSHQKIVVIDNYTIIGSHNWSSGAFSNQTQDSVLVEDERLALYYSHRIGQEWLHLHNIN